ncbi:hypothetical protein FB45DRAFT_746540 [Roridomyces roridus]|uniref:Rho-GAP domain-containing protein n=1 Tax=Roridomyces roridus TaxID=1738132 RepID=A0AAD7BU69_9AGAR|nr:hypothetical protein FB45DRAFT_746540 [Roridomyces roridus]
MPSFLSRLFNRKPSSEERSPRPPSTSDASPSPPSPPSPSLLDGKFQIPTPTIPAFDIPSPPEKDGLGLFKSKSITRSSRATTPGRTSKDLDWQLSLKLPGPAEESSRALGVVFEADPDAQILVAESVIGERRLSPLETFLLVQACGQAIKERGLETLGIFVPHFYSSSPSVQRKLISLFIQSLALKSPITTLSPTASSPVSAFESEIGFTRPHDVAAVLRWGLRHLQLDNFGNDDQWYTQFLTAEKSSNYPARAFTQELIPLLPPAHLHLLTAALDIFSSLAAHAEANGISGSKISKMLGLWLLAAPRVTEGDDFSHFYATWERWGRVLEHLFLAKIRDEAADHRMPARLTELVKQYPYLKSPSPDTHTTSLSPPPFSTRRFDALLVRIETEVPSSGSKRDKNHPLRLIADALKASLKTAPEGTSATPELDLWESLKKHVSIADANSETYPGLSNLFAEETVRFLSLIPSSYTKADDSPPFTLFIPSAKIGRRRSISLGARDKAVATVAAAHVKAASAASTAAPGPSTSPADSIGIDWTQFSTSGFFENGSGSKLASTLLDNKDVEVTLPRNPSTRRKLPPALIPLPPSHSRGKSLDLPASQKQEDKQVKQGKSKAVKLEIVQLDEAFMDFWSDGLLDPISSNWPSFVVCKIKSSVPSQKDGKRVDWLVLEQQFVTPRPPPPPIVTTPEKETFSAARPRPNSPRPSFGSDSKSTKKKRFSFFTSLSSSSISSSSTSGTKAKKAAKGAKIGEMGEILKEEEEPSPLTAQTNGTDASVSSTQVAAAATAAAALGAAAAATAVDVAKKDEPAPTLVEDAANVQVPSAEPESQPVPAVDEKPSLVEDVDNAQVLFL